MTGGSSPFNQNNVWFPRPTAAEIAAGTSQEVRAWAPVDVWGAVDAAIATDPGIIAAIDALIDARILAVVGGVATPAAGALTVAAGAATVDMTGAYRYLSCTVTATFAITLTSTKASWTGAYIYLAITNSGAGVTAPTFAAGPTVYYEGSTTFDTTAAAVNVMRIECLDDSGAGVYTYTYLPRV